MDDCDSQKNQHPPPSGELRIQENNIRDENINDYFLHNRTHFVGSRAGSETYRKFIDWLFFLQNYHSWISIFFCHPANPFTRRQKIFVMACVLCLDFCLCAAVEYQAEFLPRKQRKQIKSTSKTAMCKEIGNTLNITCLTFMSIAVIPICNYLYGLFLEHLAVRTLSKRCCVTLVPRFSAVQREYKKTEMSTLQKVAKGARIVQVTTTRSANCILQITGRLLLFVGGSFSLAFFSAFVYITHEFNKEEWTVVFLGLLTAEIAAFFSEMLIISLCWNWRWNREERRRENDTAARHIGGSFALV